MSISERIITIRKSAKLTQTEFGKKIGVSRSVIKNIELDTLKKGIPDNIIKLIAATFDVNETWLLTGEGEMYTERADSLIKQVAEKYRMDDFQTKLLDMYLHLTAEQKDAVKEFIKKLNDDF